MFHENCHQENSYPRKVTCPHLSNAPMNCIMKANVSKFKNYLRSDLKLLKLINQIIWKVFEIRNLSRLVLNLSHPNLGCEPPSNSMALVLLATAWTLSLWRHSQIINNKKLNPWVTYFLLSLRFHTMGNSSNSDFSSISITCILWDFGGM